MTDAILLVCFFRFTLTNRQQLKWTSNLRTFRRIATTWRKRYVALHRHRYIAPLGRKWYYEIKFLLFTMLTQLTSLHLCKCCPCSTLLRSIDSISHVSLLNRWFVFWFCIVFFRKQLGLRFKHFAGRHEFAVLQTVNVSVEWSTS